MVKDRDQHFCTLYKTISFCCKWYFFFCSCTINLVTLSLMFPSLHKGCWRSTAGIFLFVLHHTFWFPYKSLLRFTGPFLLSVQITENNRKRIISEISHHYTFWSVHNACLFFLRLYISPELLLLSGDVWKLFVLCDFWLTWEMLVKCQAVLCVGKVMYLQAISRNARINPILS